ncbi:transmembrane 68 [Brachionus plicatilis]|uniref:Transmembrane 68 n=1 Tax=Brachionus plicatilis TaxID=10195 RepID=A0A3M7RSB9_BRAPC|nr:transmembrane 68 [Brachionus plicatilis]
MQNSTQDIPPFSFCERIAQFILPTFFANLQANGFTDLYDFLFNFYQNQSDLNEKLSAQYVDSINLNNSLINDFSQDLKCIYKLCLKIESNLFYLEWIFKLYLPLVYGSLIFIISPLLIFISLYASSFFLYLTKHWSKLKSDYEAHDVWQASIKCVLIFCESLGAILHGHELIGLENIPDEGPGLLIYYHGLLPVDYYYVHAKVKLYKNRQMKIVADRFLFKLPGFGSLLEALEVTPGSVESCTNILKEGNLMSISPGGVKEALYSDQNYQIIWGSRCGFAKVAQAARAPIIPMFTENSREAFRCFPYFEKFVHKIYEKTRLPLIPIYGIFPVKLRTYIGEPIPYDESRTPEELKQLTKERIEDLIKKNQRLPGSRLQAILDRFRVKRQKMD